MLKLVEILDDPNFDKIYVITELATNGTLNDKIMSKDFTKDKIRKYFRDLIYALEYCHDYADVVHRDIKPENILVDSEDNCKLADFGVSF